MQRRLGITGFWVRVMLAWAAIAVLTVLFGTFVLDRSAGFSCSNILRPQLVAAGVAVLTAPYLFSVYTRRLRDVGDGVKLVWVLLAASALYFAMNIVALSSCEPGGTFPGFALPMYGQIANQVASWLGGLVSLGWTALTLYAGLRKPVLAPNRDGAEHD